MERCQCKDCSQAAKKEIKLFLSLDGKNALPVQTPKLVACEECSKHIKISYFFNWGNIVETFVNMSMEPPRLSFSKLIFTNLKNTSHETTNVIHPISGTYSGLSKR